MANSGPNKGRRLRLAVSRFAAMLVEEAMDFTKLSFEQLDQVLGYEEGTVYRYSIYPPKSKTRAPTSIQVLERRVAKLLKRQEHKIVIEDNSILVTTNNSFAEIDVGRPEPGVNVRTRNELDLQLGYEDNWPTYRCLKYSFSSLIGTDFPLHRFAWQWGILWEKGYPGLTLEDQGFPSTYQIEDAIRELMARAKQARRQLGNDLLQLPDFYRSSP